MASAATRRLQPHMPFVRLNLRRNPFGTLTPDEQAQLAVVPSLPALVDRLQTGSRVALLFTGDKGRGKSTHLRALEYALPNACYCFFPEHGPPPLIPTSGLLILDELQRMPMRARARLFRSGRVLVIGSHEDHTRELDDAGYVVEHHHLDGPDVATLTQLLRRRIEMYRRGPGDVPRLSLLTIEKLHARHRGDVRALLDELYDVFQQLEAPVDVEM